MPRPRLHANDAERKRAFRERARRQREALQAAASPDATVLRAPVRVVGTNGQLLLEITDGMLGPEVRLFDRRGILTATVSVSAGLVLVDAPEARVVVTQSLR